MQNRQINKLTSISLWVTLALVISAPGQAEQADSPLFIEGTIKVDAEKLIQLAQTLPTLILIDSRIAGDRHEGYIEGSISLPDVTTTCNHLAKIIPRLNNPVLFYCNGIKCGRSKKAIKIAQSCGYKNIYWFRGGFKEWSDKGYPAVTQD